MIDMADALGIDRDAAADMVRDTGPLKAMMAVAVLVGFR